MSLSARLKLSCFPGMCMCHVSHDTWGAVNGQARRLRRRDCCRCQPVLASDSTGSWFPHRERLPGEGLNHSPTPQTPSRHSRRRGHIGPCNPHRARSAERGALAGLRFPRGCIWRGRGSAGPRLPLQLRSSQGDLGLAGTR